VHNSSVRGGGPKLVGGVLEELQELERTRPTPTSRRAQDPDADFFDELARRAPTIARAVDLAGGPAAIMALPDPVCPQPPAPAPELQLFALAPWAPHTFPERKKDGRPRYLQRKVCRATRVYPCESIDLAPGHRPSIKPGEQYLRVNVQPQGAGGLNRWRHVRLCRACAIAYGLAETQPPGGD